MNTKVCNAQDTSGCSQPPVATVFTQGRMQNQDTGNLAAIVLDSVTHTLYVGDAHDGPICMINTATCNSTTLSGCKDKLTTNVNGDNVIIDDFDHSVYAGRSDDGSFVVFNETTCNAQTQSDCSAVSVAQLPAGFGALALGDIEPQTKTLYLSLLASDQLGYVAVIDASTCNATNHSGCGQTPTLVQAGGNPTGVLIDPTTHTGYVLNESSSSISVIDTATCNAKNPSGCPETVPALATALNPTFFFVNVGTHTIYTPSQDSSKLWVQDALQCNAQHTEGCTRFAPTAGVGAGALQPKENSDTHSLYVTSQIANTVTIIDTNQCNSGHLDGCSQTWPSFAVGTAPRFVGLNRSTNTLYVVNQGDNTVAVINGATCNSSTTSGCANFATTAVGNTAQQVVVDEASNTIYVENQGDNTVSVIDGSHCNASDSSGCNQTWPVAPVGAGPQGLGFNPNNHTIYVANTDDKSVSVIDTAHCSGADSSGCTPLATFPVGAGPRAVGIVFDTNTVFVGNRDDLSVSVIDGSTCNATDISGCPQIAPPAVVVGSFPASGGSNFNILGRSIKVDQQSHRIFIPTPADSDVVVLDGNVCRANHVNQCVPKIVPKRMGGFALVAEVDESSGTVYVTNNAEGTVSVFAESR